MAIHKPDVLYQKVVEIDERVTLEDYAEDPERKTTKVEMNHDDNNNETTSTTSDIVRGQSGEAVRILQRPDKAAIRNDLQNLYNDGFRSIAICLMHSYTFTDHEDLIETIAKSIGFTHISTSSKLMPMIKFVPRATSASADAYLTPEIKRYISGFERGFEGGLGSDKVLKEGKRATRCEFMQSDGGLVDVAQFSGLRAILSGPAGGVVGYALTSYDPEVGIPVIGFDMVREFALHLGLILGES